MNSHGASPACAVLDARPASRESSSGQPKPITPTTDAANSASAERGRMRIADTALIGRPPSRRLTSSTVSNGSGANTFDTCGANTGEDSATSRAGPSLTISPSASTTMRSATSATSSTSCVAIRTPWPSPASRVRIATSRRFVA